MVEFRAMGTDWRVEARGLDSPVAERVRAIVEREEERFSRFRATSTLTALNRRRYVTDEAVADVARLALRLRRATAGAFDPGLGAAVAGAGYDRSFEDVVMRSGLAPPPLCGASERADLTVRGKTVRLGRTGRADLGGIAKGWTVDRVGRYLRSRGSTQYLIDAGGDILVYNAPTLGDTLLNDPESDTPGTVIAIHDTPWSVRLTSGAVATSSTLRRSWYTARGRMHHIIEPVAGTSAQGRFVSATVVAPRAAQADALATALVANAEATLPALSAFGAEAFLVDLDGVPQMTPGMERWLT